MTSVALLSGAIFGAIIYLVAFLPLHDKPNFAIRSLIATLAINIATVQFFYGGLDRDRKLCLNCSALGV